MPKNSKISNSIERKKILTLRNIVGKRIDHKVRINVNKLSQIFFLGPESHNSALILKGIQGYFEIQSSWNVNWILSNEPKTLIRMALEKIWACEAPTDKINVVLDNRSGVFDSLSLENNVESLQDIRTIIIGASDKSRHNFASAQICPFSISALAREYFFSNGIEHLAVVGRYDSPLFEAGCKAFELASLKGGETFDRLDSPHARLGFELKHKSYITTCAESEDAELVKWLTALPKPLGVFVCDDRFLNEVLRACDAAQLRVPTDVRILSAGSDSVVGELASQSIPYIQTPWTQLGKLIAQTIMKWSMQNTIHPAPSPVNAIVSRVVIPASGDSAHVHNSRKEVAQSVAFIRENFHRSISIRDIVEHVAVSRRWIELQFQKQMKCSMMEYIRKLRIQHAKKLLVETSLSITELAACSGFNSATQLSVAFRRTYKSTPTEYRRENSKL